VAFVPLASVWRFEISELYITHTARNSFQ